MASKLVLAGQPFREKLHRINLRIKPAQKLWALVRFVIVFGICFVVLFPVIKRLSLSVMEEGDLLDATIMYVAKHFTVDNYALAWQVMDYPATFIRTIGLSLVASVLQLCSCVLVAYGFARFKFPGRGILFGMVILTMVVPPQVIILPLFSTFRYFNLFGLGSLVGFQQNLIGSYWPFALMSITAVGFKNGLYIYILRQYFKGQPKELEEAAYVDGAGRIKTFTSIMLPGAVPMMVTVFLFAFVWQWTDSFYSGLFLPSYKVMSLALNSLAENASQLLGTALGATGTGYLSMLSNTGVLLAIAPLIILYLVLQRFFMEGISRSGLVG